MTMIETLIAVSLMLAIFVGVFLILDRGLRFYRLNSDVNDRQRGVLLFLARLNVAMQNTQASLVFVDPPTGIPPSGAVQYNDSQGLSYASPFDSAGKPNFDVTTHRLLWQAYGCFYRTPNDELRWVKQDNTTLANPNGPTDSPPPPELTSPPFTPSHFATTGSGNLIAKDVTRLDFVLHQAGDTPPGYSQPLKSAYYDVAIECGKQGDPNGYWIRVQSSFYPRN